MDYIFIRHVQSRVNISTVKGRLAIKATGGPDNIAFVYCYDVNIIM